MTQRTPRPLPAEQEADLVQDALDRIAAGADAGRVLAGCQEEVAESVRLALTLADALPARAPGDFKAQLQVRLQTAMDRQSSRGRLWPRTAPRLVLRLAGVTLALALVFASAVAASAEALPGDAFYGVKRAVEVTRLRLAATPRARARLRLSQAEIRLDEIRRLVNQGVAVSPQVVDDLVESHRRAEAEALTAGGDLARDVQLRVAQGIVVLRALAEQADSASGVRLTKAADALALIAPAGAAEPVAPVPTRAASSAPVAVATTTRGPAGAEGPAVSATATTASAPRPGPAASATASPLAAATPLATSAAGEPSSPGAPLTEVPATATPVPGVTQPVNPVGTERAIVLTQQPRRTQAAPPTRDSSAGGAATAEATPAAGGDGGAGAADPTATPVPDPGGL